MWLSSEWKDENPLSQGYRVCSTTSYLKAKGGALTTIVWLHVAVEQDDLICLSGLFSLQGPIDNQAK